MNNWQRLLFAVVALFSSAAYAHFPTLTCNAAPTDAGVLVCYAGYSDASKGAFEVLKVFSYDDELLSTVKTDAKGTVTLPMPAGEFYIVFDPGHESPAEFDYAEL